jgi:anti-sigma regulatory factor (Ser/Thr protein kinase)
VGPLSRTGPFPAGAASVEEIGWFAVEGPGTAGMVRRAATEAARGLGFGENRQAELAIAMAEITSNLYKHADDGSVHVRCLRHHGIGAVEAVAVDRGPGMADPARSGRDGHSTAGTLGIGMGAVSRLTNRWDMYTQPGQGTTLAVQFWPSSPGREPADAGTETGPVADGITRPLTGETVSGDRYAIRSTPAGQLLLLADGLGHGNLAANASSVAVDAFLAGSPDSPAKMVDRLHWQMGHTRGAAIGVAELDWTAGVARFAGLGNIASHVVSAGTRRTMVSLPGIAGHRCRSVRQFDYPLPGDALVVMHSDGVRDRWNLDDYPGLAAHAPLVVAATLLRDAGVRRDDASVLVAAPGDGAGNGVR